MQNGPRVFHGRQVNDLVSELRDPGRAVPIIVVSAGRDHPEELERCAQRFADVFAGVSLVAVIDHVGAVILPQALGRKLRVAGGAVRIYLPELGQGVFDPEQHPYVAAAQMREPTKAVREVGRTIRRWMLRLKPPAAVGQLRLKAPAPDEPKGPAANDGQLAELEQLENDVTTGLASLRVRIEDLEDGLGGVTEGLERLETRIESLIDSLQEQELLTLHEEGDADQEEPL